MRYLIIEGADSLSLESINSELSLEEVRKKFSQSKAVTLIYPFSEVSAELERFFKEDGLDEEISFARQHEEEFEERRSFYTP